MNFEREDINVLALTRRDRHPSDWRCRAGITTQTLGPNVGMLLIEGSKRVQHIAARLAHGLEVGIGRADGDVPMQSTVRSCGLLTITVVTAGGAYLRPTPVHVRAGQCVVRLLPRDTVFGAEWPAHQLLATLRLSIDPESLVRDYPVPGGVGVLHEAINGSTVLDLDARTRRLADEASELDVTRPGASLDLEGLSLQVLRSVMSQVLARGQPVGRAASTNSTPDDLLSVRSSRQAHAARHMLSLYYANPPSVIELARRVGSNPDKLGREFKVLFGQSIKEFVVSSRMEKARSLLLSERITVAEIGFRVGYQHHSSFTAAFTDFFGAAPSVVASAARLH